MRKRFKSFFILILIFFSFFITTPIKNNCVNAEDFSSAKAVCVIEANSSRVLYSKNMNQKLPMASTTKIVTALTVLKVASSGFSLFTANHLNYGIKILKAYYHFRTTLF